MSFLSVTPSMKARFLTALEGIDHGRLTLTTPEGNTHVFGQPGGIEADLQIFDWSVLTALVARGDIGLGQTYVQGLWETSAPEPLLTLALRNIDQLAAYAEPGPLHRLAYRLLDRLVRPNSLRGAARNIRAHYDVGNEFYQLWLDPGMTYSAALFAPDDADGDLPLAQDRKYDRILDRLPQAERVLEIGCGWGGFAERAADRGRQVTALTISPSQKAYADARLDGRADVRLQDYRKAGGTYDAIVSIEMIEAVGERYWPAYFATLRDRLAPGGTAMLQAITISDAEFSLYRRRSDFIRHHAFPGGMLPCDAVISREAARAGLAVRESFAFGQDYARTCRIWARRLMQARPRILRLGRDEGFLRFWRFYLESCAATFASGRTDVVQVQLVRA